MTPDAVVPVRNSYASFVNRNFLYIMLEKKLNKRTMPCFSTQTIKLC
jgi:hypothetical protein